MSVGADRCDRYDDGLFRLRLPAFSGYASRAQIDGYPWHTAP